MTTPFEIGQYQQGLADHEEPAAPWQEDFAGDAGHDLVAETYLASTTAGDYATDGAVDTTIIGIETNDADLLEDEEQSPIPPRSITFVPVRGENDKPVPLYALDQEPQEGSDLAEMAASFVASEQKMRDSVHFDTEVRLTQKEEIFFNDITEAYGALADQLGVPEAKGRITQQAHLHMFTNHDDFVRAAVAVNGCDPKEAASSAGTHNPRVGILLERYADPVEGASALAHEIAHDLGAITLTPTGETDTQGRQDVQVTTGHPVAGRGLNEFTADMLADRIVRPLLGDSYVTYGGMDAIGDAVICQVALAGSPQFVEDELVRGYLNGEATARMWIQATLGKQGADLFFSMTGDESLTESLDIARKIGLPRAEQMIQDMIDRKKVHLFAWR